LPPAEDIDKTKITLVLDLDETLVHSSFVAVPNPDFTFSIELEENQICVYICVRPGARDFLRRLKDYYELVLFTASTQPYADRVVDEIDPESCIKYRLYRESCTNVGGVHVKDLSKLGRNLDRTIIIDNSSVAYLLQPYNAIAITSWYDDRHDRELFSIQDMLLKSYRVTTVYNLLSDL